MTRERYIAGAAAALASVLAFLIGSEASADASAWHANERGGVRLVSGVAATGRSNIVTVGVELRLAPGWKTYWRVPGESGIPPRFDWAGSANVADASVIWPGPTRFTIAGMQSYGYEGRVILPIRIELGEAGRSVSLRLHLRYAICREVCVPEEARLALDLPVGPARATPHTRAIAAFAARAARPGERLGWRIERAGLVVAPGNRAELVVEVASAAVPFRAPELVAEGNEQQRFGLSAASLSADRRRARFVLPYRRLGDDAAAISEPGGQIPLSLLDGPRHGSFAIRIGGPQN